MTKKILLTAVAVLALSACSSASDIDSTMGADQTSVSDLPLEEQVDATVDENLEAIDRELEALDVESDFPAFNEADLLTE